MSAQTVSGYIKSAGRNPYLDSLKLTMSLMVICIHTDFAHTWSSLTTFDYFTSGLCRIAVPVFLIINGFFYSNKGFKHTFKTVFGLYLLWTILYTPFWLYDLFCTPFLSLADVIHEVVLTTLFGYFHLWYLNGLMVALVLFHLLFRHATPRRILFSVVPLFWVGAALQYLATYLSELAGPDSLWQDILLDIHTYRNALFFALPFFCMGVFFKRANVLKNTPLNVMRLLLLLSCVLFAFELWSKDRWLIPSNQDLYLSLILVAPLMFAVCCQMPTRFMFRTPAVSDVATKIYLIHPALLFTMFHLFGKTPTLPGIIAAICVSLIWFHLQRVWHRRREAATAE